MARRYGAWAGCPNGFPENPLNCIKEVYPTGRSMIPHQCRRKRGHGGNGEYCSTHAKTTESIRAFRNNTSSNGRNEN